MSTSLVYAQLVGINTDEPDFVLDINGDLRIRKIPIGSSTSDDVLVIDKDGIVKKSMVSNSYFRGYLAADFTSSSTDFTISKIVGFTIIDQPSDEFDIINYVFTPSFSGLYNFKLTLTSTYIDDIKTPNVVYGLVNQETNKWVIRYSVPKSYITDLGLNSVSGATTSFSGAVLLTKGKKYYFGVTEKIKLLSNPSGNTGEGIGSYVALELIKTE